MTGTCTGRQTVICFVVALIFPIQFLAVCGRRDILIDQYRMSAALISRSMEVFRQGDIRRHPSIQILNVMDPLRVGLFTVSAAIQDEDARQDVVNRLRRSYSTSRQWERWPRVAQA